jgi:hypothetical protein
VPSISAKILADVDGVFCYFGDIFTAIIVFGSEEAFCLILTHRGMVPRGRFHYKIGPKQSTRLPVGEIVAALHQSANPLWSNLISAFDFEASEIFWRVLRLAMFTANARGCAVYSGACCCDVTEHLVVTE